jgi:DNA-binding winged helix-turn-helix (wHTH) protein/tetratricopeptide (TPR) repeat protein
MAASADPKARQLYEFGPFRVDPEKDLLLHEDEAVPIAPKAFQILLVLVRNNKQLVTKDELLKAIWPDTFVEEANLSRNIFLLRKALGESPQDHQYIVTVPGRGYRFAEDVKLVPEHELDVIAASHSSVEVEVEESGRWGWIAAAAVLLIAVAAGAWKLFFHRAPALTEKDTVVLADFTNLTGDPVFDGTLRQGLAVQLEQSPYLRLISDERIRQTLRLMNKPADARLTPEIAREICERTGSAATLDGSITNLGSQYVLGLKAINCRNGETLDEQQVQAVRKEDALNALTTIAQNFRSRVGESLNTISEHNTPLEQATTSSLDALQDYSAGLSIMDQGHFRTAIPLFERAIAIDPNFAMAYYLRGIAYEQAGDVDRSTEDSKRAFNLVDRVSETERTDITAYYYRFTGELDKELDAWQLAARNYPRNWGPHNQISVTRIDMGQFEEGLKEGEEAARLEPAVEPPWRRQLDALMCLNRLPEAEALATKVRAAGINGSRIHQRFLELAYLQDDHASIDREIQWFSGKPEEYLSLGLQAAYLNMHGERAESSKEYQRAAEASRRLGLGYVADDFEEADARADALAGNCQSVRHHGRSALALALCGETAKAEELAAATSKLFPNGTIWNAVQLPEIEASIAPSKGIELLASALPYERAYPDAVYVRGVVYLQMKRGAEAATEFKKIADHEGASWGATWVHPYWGQYYAMSYLGMARGYALAGDTTQAKVAYEKFFAFWKTADADLPVLRQAKAEYASLNGQKKSPNP